MHPASAIDSTKPNAKAALNRLRSIMGEPLLLVEYGLANVRRLPSLTELPRAEE